MILFAVEGNRELLNSMRTWGRCLGLASSERYGEDIPAELLAERKLVGNDRSRTHYTMARQVSSARAPCSSLKIDGAKMCAEIAKSRLDLGNCPWQQAPSGSCPSSLDVVRPHS